MQKVKLNNISPIEVLISINVAALVMSNIGLADLSNNEGGIKLHHVITAMNFVLLLTNLRIPTVSLPLRLYFFVTVLTSLFGYAKYGFNIQFLNVMYCFVVALVFAKAVSIIGYEETLRAIRVGFLVSLISVYVKNIIIADQIVDQLRLGYRVFTWNLVAGGPNQEAAWLIMGSSFFLGTKKFWLYLVASSLLAVLYLSRGGYLAVTIIIILVLFQKLGRERSVYVAIIATIFLTVVSIIFYTSDLQFQIGIPIVDRAIARFYSGSDLGTEGRELLYQAAIIAFEKEQFGFGAMNATVVMGSYVGHDFIEGNVHNIYLQLLLDGGFVCLFSFAFMLKRTFSNACRIPNSSRVITFVACYCILGLIRFRGYDPIFYLVVGLIEGAVLTMHARTKTINIRYSQRGDKWNKLISPPGS